MGSSGTTKNSVTFSIIIPTYNRPQELTSCLDSLTLLEYENDGFEVIVIDDGSPVSPEPAITPFRDRISLRLLKQKKAGPASARNAGASQARGRFLAFTDDDCRPARNWLKELGQRLHTEPGSMVGGRVVNAVSENICSSASHLILDIVYAYYNVNGMDPHFFASNNMAVATDPFLSAGGFDTSYPEAGGEDREFCDRWRGIGYQMVYEPAAIIWHTHKLNLRTFWKQHKAYGRGAFRFNRSHARRGAEDSTLRYDFYTSFFRRFGEATPGLPRSRVRMLALLMCLWQIANTMGFTSEMIKYLIRRQRIR
jgi:glycosyltransferase involved in cell wall biosynthesis